MDVSCKPLSVTAVAGCEFLAGYETIVVMFTALVERGAEDVSLRVIHNFALMKIDARQYICYREFLSILSWTHLTLH